MRKHPFKIWARILCLVMAAIVCMLLLTGAGVRDALRISATGESAEEMAAEHFAGESGAPSRAAQASDGSVGHTMETSGRPSAVVGRRTAGQSVSSEAAAVQRTVLSAAQRPGAVVARRQTPPAAPAVTESPVSEAAADTRPTPIVMVRAEDSSAGAPSQAPAETPSPAPDSTDAAVSPLPTTAAPEAPAANGGVGLPSASVSARHASATPVPASSTPAPEDVPTASQTVTTAAPAAAGSPAPTAAAGGGNGENGEDDEEMPMGAQDLRVQAQIEQQNAQMEENFKVAEISGDLYADFHFTAQTMQGIFNQTSVYANLPEYAIPRSAVLRLSYTASSLIYSETSTLTFYMNGTPFASSSVQSNGERTETLLYIEVPADLLQPDYNLLEISVYDRLTDDDDEGCTDDYNRANWLSISDASCLRVVYDLVEDTTDLSLFPFPFLSLVDETGANCAVTVSNATEDAELTAALTLMADLGNNTAIENEIEFARIGDTDRANIIYFGLADNTPLELLGMLDEAVPPTGAIVQRAQRNGREYLLVISQEQEALLEAARYLADATRVEQTEATSIHISVGEAQSYIDARRNGGLVLEGNYTLEDMLGNGMSFSGPFHQERILYLPLEQDYALSSNSRFTLNIRYSENLDFDRSAMTVYWGSDVPLFSRKLSAEGAMGETVSFAVPADAVGRVSNMMVIAFDLEIQDLDCTPRQLNMPWAYVAEDSTFYLPQGENTMTDLGHLPAPFQRNNLLDDVLLILPDDPDQAELLLAGRLMSMLGIGSDPYGDFSVTRASAFDSSMRDNHLVIIGTPTDNLALRTLNDSLFFRYTEDYSAVESNDKLVLTGAYASKVGTFQLLASPYAEGRSILVVSSPSEDGIRALTEVASKDENRWDMEREVLLVDTRGRATSYQFTVTTTSADQVEKPSFTEVVTQNMEPMLLLIIGVGCMLILLIAVVIVLVRIRSNKHSDK